MYNFANAARVGPGVWVSFMLLSARAESQHERNWICKYVRDFCSYFKCLDCRQHALEYLSDNPPETEAFSNMSLFQWVVTFLNSVNVRQNKPIYDIKILWKQFTDDSFMLCGNSHAEDLSRKQITRTFVPTRRRVQ